MTSSRSLLTVMILAAVVLLSGAFGGRAVTLPFADDFECYASGVYPTETGWRTWQSGTTAAVSDLVTHSGIRSFRLLSRTTWTRCDYLPIEQVPARLSYQASVYMDPIAGRSARLGLANGSSSQLQLFSHFIVRNDNGVVGAVQFQGESASAPIELGQFAIGGWITLRADLDFDQQTAVVWLNDEVAAVDVPIEPQEFDDASSGHVVLNRFVVTECNWPGSGYGALYVDDVALFEAVTPTIEAVVTLEASTISLRSRGRWVTCAIELPAGYLPNDIAIDSLLLQGTIGPDPHPAVVADLDLDGIPELVVKFSRSALAETLTPGRQTIELTGALVDGTPIAGDCTVAAVR